MPPNSSNDSVRFIMDELESGAEMEQITMIRPHALRSQGPFLYWLEGAVQELYRVDLTTVLYPNSNSNTNSKVCDGNNIKDSTNIINISDVVIDKAAVSKVIVAGKRVEKMTVEEELERERTRSRSKGVDNYTVSDDNNRIVYRCNGKWSYYLINTAETFDIFKEFTPDGEGSGFPECVSVRKKDLSEISFTYNCNIFIATIRYVEGDNNKGNASDFSVSFERITSIGGVNSKILCGQADYIIKEEFSRYTGHWVSDTHILYTISDETKLNTVNIIKDDDMERMPYCKVGDDNPLVAICAFDRVQKKHSVLSKVVVEAICGGGDGNVSCCEYFPRLGIIKKGDQKGEMLSKDMFYFSCLSRDQERFKLVAVPFDSLTVCPSEKDILSCWLAPLASGSLQDSEALKASIVLNEQTIPWAWVDITDSLLFSKERLLIGMHVNEDANPEQKSHYHIFMKDNLREVYRNSSVGTEGWRQITKGPYNVQHNSIKVVGNQMMYLGGSHHYLGSTLNIVNISKAPVSVGSVTDSGVDQSCGIPLTSIDEYVYSYVPITDKSMEPLGADGDDSEPPQSLKGIAVMLGSAEGVVRLVVLPKATRDDNNGESVRFGPSVVVPTAHRSNPLTTTSNGISLISPIVKSAINRRGVRLPYLLYTPTFENAKKRCSGDISSGSSKNGVVRVPLLMHVYGGPHAQLVRHCFYDHTYSPFFQALLQRGFAVIVADNQMSHANTLKEHSICKKNMGQFEIADYLDILDTLSRDQDSEDNTNSGGVQVDTSRVAISGWSYGGYVTLLAMCQAADRFKLGFAGAPVGDWRLYDTGYTERYMGLLPRDNDSYDKGSIIKMVQGLPEEPLRLFIAHGLTDENVHFANSCAVVDAITAAKKPFQLQVYPGERHGLRQKPHSWFHYRAQMLATLVRLL